MRWEGEVWWQKKDENRFGVSSVYLNLSQGNIRQIAMLMFMCSESSSAHKKQNAFSYHRIGNDKERSFTDVNV